MDNITALIQALPMKEATKARMQESLVLMVNARDRGRCSQMRFELQGMINALEAEEVITIQNLDALGKAFGHLWRSLNQGFIMAGMKANKQDENQMRQEVV